MDSFYSKARSYENVLPYNEDLLPRHRGWEKWFDNKKTVIDDPGIDKMDIDEWMNTPCDDDIHSSDEEAVVVDYDSGKEIAEACENIPNTNLQVGLKGCNTMAGKSERFDLKHYFDKIFNASMWPQGIDNLQPPISKNFNTTKDTNNGWFGNLNKFKGIVKIAETRTICYSRNFDSDSDDTAEYIRDTRGKGRKSSIAKSKTRLKEYSNAATIKLEKTIEMNRFKRKIMPNFPLDESESCSEKEVTPPRIYNKMRRTCVQSQINTVTMHSGSSSDGNHRYHIDYQTRSSDSDPDDQILDNFRKIHKNVTQDLIEPAIVAHSTTNNTAEPSIEFPPETDQQLAIYDNNKCANISFIELSSDSDEAVKSEQDFICMSNAERLLSYGKSLKCENRQKSISYDWIKSFTINDDSSTDDDLFKLARIKMN